MLNNNIVLNSQVSHGKIVRIGIQQNNSTSQPEDTGPTDDGHLAMGMEYWVVAQNGESATIVGPMSEDQVHGHNVTRFLHRRRAIQPLGSANYLGSLRRANSQRVIHHQGCTEVGR